MIDYRGKFRIDKPSDYEFRLLSAAGAILSIDDRVVIDNDGLRSTKSEDQSDPVER